MNETKRCISSGMEEILNKEFKALNHGFIRVVDYMGNDNAIVQAARVSYGDGTKTINEDKGLISYLLKHKHTSPFEMCEIKLHIKLPIFIARQWIRHRTASVNEYSARYSILSNEFYIPELDRLQIQSKDNKQGSGEALPPEIAQKVKTLLEEDAKRCYKTYEDLLSEEVNLARELARVNLNLNYYTEWYWKIDLHNLLHFIRLRIHKHAQYEIRVYSEILAEIIKNWVPFTYEAFNKYQIDNQDFSSAEYSALIESIDFSKLEKEVNARVALGILSKREAKEFLNKFKK